MYITKETKWHLSCHCHDNSYAAGPVLIKTKIPRFYLKQGSSTPDNLIGRVRTQWEPFVFPARPSVPFQWVANGIFDFSQKEIGAKSVAMVTTQVSFCFFSGAKFEEPCSNTCISRDILDSVFNCSSGTIYDVISFLIWIIQKRKWIIQKRKMPFFFTLKSLSNKQLLFFFFIGTLNCTLCHL